MTADLSPPPASRLRPRRGYVLLMALMLLALAAAALASVGRQSTARALAALRAQEDLQRRWGTLSCQVFLLPRAESVLRDAEAARFAPVAVVSRRLGLGGRSLELVFSDEQAKANLNTIRERRGRDAAASAAWALLRDASVSVAVDLAPGPPSQPGGSGVPAWGAWGEIFHGASPASLIGGEGWPAGYASDAARSPAAVDEATLWGSGRLNWLRCSRAALAQVAGPLLSPGNVEALLVARTERLAVRLEDALARLGLSNEQRSRLDAVLTQGSACHGLWIIDHTGGRRYDRLAVEDASSGSPGAGAATGSGSGGPRTYLLEW